MLSDRPFVTYTLWTSGWQNDSGPQTGTGHPSRRFRDPDPGGAETDRPVPGDSQDIGAAGFIHTSLISRTDSS